MPGWLAVPCAALAGGVAAALAIASLAVGADLASRWHAGFAHAQPVLNLLLMPAGFAALAWITRRAFHGAQGGGVPQALAALRANDPGPETATQLSLRIALGKVVLTAAGFACGASIGREGPGIQIGASILHSLRGRGAGRRALIVAGAAAGVAATFATPLAALVFAFEQMARGFERRLLPASIIAIAAATSTIVLLFGYRPYFGAIAFGVPAAPVWCAALACGAAGGLAGGLFSRALVGGQNWLRPWASARPAAIAAGAGLLVALLGLASGGSIYGSGFGETRELLHGGALHVAADPALKFAATLLSSLAGIPGGLFSPTLAIGAGLGAEFAPWLDAVPMATLALLGMAAYQTGVMQAPLTAAVLVAEMVGAPQALLPLLATSLVAMAASRCVSRESVYEGLCRSLTAK